MVFDYAIRDGRTRANPCAGVELPSGASPEMLFLSAGEVRALVEAVDRCSQGRRCGNGTYGLLVEFAAFTGLRAGEIAALRIRDVDLREGTVRIERSAARVGGSRIEGAPKTRAGRRTGHHARFLVTPQRCCCTRTPGRPSKALASAVTTVRSVALAVAAMIRSWAPRGDPSRRTRASSSAWSIATLSS